jgi:hypothetical protein
LNISKVHNWSLRSSSHRSWSLLNQWLNMVLHWLQLCYYNAALWGSIQLQPGSGHFCTIRTSRKRTEKNFNREGRIPKKNFLVLFWTIMNYSFKLQAFLMKKMVFGTIGLSS